MTVPEQWHEQSRVDIDAARVMFDTGRFVFVPYFCQQAIETALKAIIVEQTGKLPPRVHNLIQLAEKAGIHADEKRQDLLRSLTEYYVDSRYPGVQPTPESGLARAQAEGFLNATEGLLKWLTTPKKL